MALVVYPDLDDIDFFPGEDHALIGNEADALGVGAISVGELADTREVGDDAGGRAAEEAGDMSVLAYVLTIEPDVTSKLLEHLVEEFAAAQLGCGTGGLLGLGAGDVAGLGVEVRCDDRAQNQQAEEAFHSESTIPFCVSLTIRLHKQTAGSFGKLRTGSSTTFDAKNASNFAQDDTLFFYGNCYLEPFVMCPWLAGEDGAAVDVEDFAGDEAGEGGAEK